MSEVKGPHLLVHKTLWEQLNESREQLQQENASLRKQIDILNEEALSRIGIEVGLKSKVEELKLKLLFNRLSDFAFEHPLYKLSKELEKENKELEEELRVTKSQLDEALSVIEYAQSGHEDECFCTLCERASNLMGSFVKVKK